MHATHKKPGHRPEQINQYLYYDDVIEFDGEFINVCYLVTNGAEFDRTPMPDPIEGSEYGQSTAMYFHNNGLKPLIHSFAHGNRTIFWIQKKLREESRG